MKFNDIGIIISCKKYSENSLILKLFSQNHGVYRGFVNSQKTKKTQAIFQIGNLISFEWRSRNEEGLGQYCYIDLVKSYTPKIIFDKMKLNCCSAIFSILDSCFLEREEQIELFEKLNNFLKKISSDSEDQIEFLVDYVKLELEILKTLGYGIDLSSCVVTESQEDLVFVSPKSARAVSFLAGKQFENKLLKLPPFLLAQNDNIENYHLYDGLKLSGYFLEKYIFSQNNMRPSSRSAIESDLEKIIAQK